MTPYYALPNLEGGFQLADTDRPRRPSRPRVVHGFSETPNSSDSLVFRISYLFRRFRLNRKSSSGKIPNVGVLRLIKRLQSVVRRSVGEISRWRERRAAIRALQALSDHHLTDIGLHRSRIVAAVEDTIETDGQTAARIDNQKQRRS